MLVYLSMIDSADDQSKFEKIYWEYQNLMYYVASQLLKNPLDIEDAVHNAFVSIAERISEIEDPVCLKTKGYVVTITEHKAVDILRKQRHCSELAIEDAPAVPIDPESKS
ncbi:MAG: sigma-70 family RNA polymerase sigma factor, partial [Oscillospiraceae bacterium]|nr:sigma-70 family RNA polymerase sigma factor [Oscillospiraceae bacterium]